MRHHRTLFAPAFRRAALQAALLGLLILTASATLVGCQHFPSQQIPKMKWLIVPFEQPAAMSEAPRSIRGWWFGARTLRRNPRAGAMMAETLSRKMSNLEFLNLYSAIELKYYFADKRQLLKESYPNLTDPELDRTLAQAPKVEFAKELGADKVLTGRIISQYMGENRTIHWWWAVLEVEVQVIDAASGKTEWSGHYNLRNQFASQSDMQERFADRLIRDLKKQYFLPMARK